MRKINEIIVHWSGTDQGDVKSFRKYHIEHNHWKDIGYHYVICRDGEIQPGRDLNQVGSHCKNHNTGSIGICVVGSPLYDVNDFQVASLELLINSLRLTLGDLKIRLHCHYANTLCPGPTLKNWFNSRCK